MMGRQTDGGADGCLISGRLPYDFILHVRGGRRGQG